MNLHHGCVLACPPIFPMHQWSLRFAVGKLHFQFVALLCGLIYSTLGFTKALAHFC